jgi:hypothetical protein
MLLFAREFVYYNKIEVKQSFNYSTRSTAFVIAHPPCSRGLACRGPDIADSIYSGFRQSQIRYINYVFFTDHAGQVPLGYINYLLGAQLFQLRLPHRPSSGHATTSTAPTMRPTSTLASPQPS